MKFDAFKEFGQIVGKLFLGTIKVLPSTTTAGKAAVSHKDGAAAKEVKKTSLLILAINPRRINEE